MNTDNERNEVQREGSISPSDLTLPVGVVSIHTPEWLLEDIIYHSDDPLMALHMANCPICLACVPGGHCDEVEWGEWGSELLIGFVECEIDDPRLIVAYGEAGDLPIGYRIADGADYAAIVGETVAQVLWSRYVQICRPCSPCYPSQGDLDSFPLDSVSEVRRQWPMADQVFLATRTYNVVAYTLPPDVWGSFLKKDRPIVPSNQIPNHWP